MANVTDVVNKEKLEAFMISRGVDAQTARLAAEQCTRAVLRDAMIGGAAGGILAAMATAEAGGLAMPAGVVIGAGVGALYAGFSEQCATVRDAAFSLADQRRSEAGGY
jgi:hypothetical protein